MSELIRRDGLKAYTPARVGLRRIGSGLATEEVLEFQLAHARARDAVHAELDVEELRSAIGGEVVALQSRAVDRANYLKRPDMGRRLNEASLLAIAKRDVDVAIVIADGLSALAVERNAAAVVQELMRGFAREGKTIGPVCVVRQGRVAVGDEVAERMGASACVLLIGERPGLSAADSLGAYVTWDPHVGRSDAERNCVSNIREGGMSAAEAAAKIRWYLSQARVVGGTGVGLKGPDGLALDL